MTCDADSTVPRTCAASPGSALKPLVAYAPAIDQYGYMTASVLKDEPTNFGGYKPRNASYTYYGNVSIRSALQSSPERGHGGAAG